LIDIREMYQKDGEDRPGKGIALNPEQYNNIKNNADDIDKLWWLIWLCEDIEI